MMPVCCANCGHLIDATRRDGVVDRMGLVVSLKPPSVFLRSKRLPSPTPTLLRYLYLLVRWGEVSSDMLSEATRSEAVTPITLQAHITHLRDWLEENKVPVVVQNIFGFGYRLARPAAGQPTDIKQAFAERGPA